MYEGCRGYITDRGAQRDEDLKINSKLSSLLSGAEPRDIRDFATDDELEVFAVKDILL